MVKRLIFIYYSIPAIASYLDTTLFDAQVDGTKVSPCSMFVRRDVLSIPFAGGSSNSMYCMARQYGADVSGIRTLTQEDIGAVIYCRCVFVMEFTESGTYHYC